MLVMHVLVSPVFASANVKSNHVIIAFDEAGTRWRLSDDRVRESIGYYLYDNSGNALLKENDYYSVVGFKADCSGEKWNDFVYVKKINKKPLSFVKSDDSLKKLFCVDTLYSDKQWYWYELSSYQGTVTDSYSLNSIAKPYILATLGKAEVKSLVNNTYIILITDHRYNGNDFYNELRYFIDTAQENGKRLDIHNVLDVCYKVEEEFCIKYVDAIEWNNSSRFVELFEVKPNQDNLTLPAVISYSPSINAKRVRGGKYSFDLDLEYVNTHFEVKKLSADLCDTGIEYLKIGMPLNHRIIDSLSFNNDYSRYHRTFEFSRQYESPAIYLSAELILKDGLYDSALLTHGQIEGLKQKIEIIKEDDAHFLFGLLRLPDFLWIPGLDQYSAAIVLDFILLGLVIAVFFAYLKISATYKPKPEDIQIRFYE